MGPLSAKLVLRYGIKKPLAGGLLIAALGLLLFARAPVDGSYLTDVLPPMIILGLGIGVSFPSLMSLAMSGATREDAGLASGLVNTTAQVGGALGLAVLATLSASRSKDLIAAGESTASALVGGYHLAFLVGAIFAAVAATLGGLLLPSTAPGGAHAEEPRRLEPAEAAD